MIDIVSVCDKEYYIGLETLMYTIAKTTGPVNLTILHDGDLKWADSIMDLGHFVTLLDVDEVTPHEDWPARSPRLKFAWNKLKVWALPPGKYLYLDTDLLCMSSIEELGDWPDFSAFPDHGGTDLMSTGIFVFEASMDAYEEQLSIAESMDRAGMIFGNEEMTVTNLWLKASGKPSHKMPMSWEIWNKDFSRRPGMWLPQQAKFIHYVGAVKPWDSDNEWGPEKLWKGVRREYLRDVR